MSELGIGWHRKASGGFTSDPHKQREFEDPTRSDVGKASGRHREIMVEHCCIGKCF